MHFDFAYGSAQGDKPAQNMIPSFLVWNELNLHAKFARFFSDNNTDTINCGFIVRRRFSFDKKFKERFCIHTKLSIEQTNRKTDQADDCAIACKQIDGVISQKFHQPLKGKPAHYASGDESNCKIGQELARTRHLNYF